jgi:hypothetical protein
MYAITANLCKKWLKKRAERLDSEPLVDQEIDKRSLAAHDDNMVHQSVHEALAGLPEIYCQVLSLYYLGGMNTREIAEFLGTSVKTIESRLSRARAKMKEEMITTMTTTFDEVRLQPGFTFRIVEAIKQTKIQAPPSKTTLPLSVSGVLGLIVLLLSLTVPYSPLYPIGQVIGSALPSQTQVLEEGEIAVDAIQIDRIISLSPEMDKGDLGKKPLPEPAPMFGGGKWERKADMPTERYALSASGVNGKIFVIGGRKVQEPLSIVEAYDPTPIHGSGRPIYRRQDRS